MTVAKIARTYNIVDTAAKSAEHAIRSTQDAANKALDNLADSVDQLRGRGSPVLERAKEQATTYAYRGLDSMRDASHRARQTALQASENTIGYIRAEPVKAVLIAAAAGAVLMALAKLLRREPEPRQRE